MADTSSNNLAGSTGGGGRDRPGKPLSPSERRQREHVERLHAGAFGRRAPSPPEEEVDAEETALREWLESCGFRPGNLRSPETLQRDHSMITPLMCACRWGRLDVCKWLARKLTLPLICWAHAISCAATRQRVRPHTRITHRKNECGAESGDGNEVLIALLPPLTRWLDYGSEEI